jgi:hypothetical protein
MLSIIKVSGCLLTISTERLWAYLGWHAAVQLWDNDVIAQCSAVQCSAVWCRTLK